MLRQLRTYYTRYLDVSEDETHIALWVAFLGGVFFGSNGAAPFGILPALGTVFAIYLVLWLAMSIEL